MYRAIIVDDEEWAIVGIRKLLEQCSDRFQIIFETTNPLEALEKICEERPDIVFTDVRMPEISGIELMHKVRQRGIDTSFVVISGFAEFTYVQQALREGAIDYQLKPIDMHKAEEMLSRVDALLRDKHDTKALTVYSLLRQGGGDVAALLRPWLKQEPYPFWQVITVNFSDSDFALDFTDLEKNIQQIRLKIGPRKCVYIFNSETEQIGDIFKCLTNNKENICSAGISSYETDMGKLSILIKASELASYKYFVDDSKIISQYEGKNIGTVMRLWNQLSEALREKQYDLLDKLLRNIPDYFLLHGLTGEDAAVLWNHIVASATEHGVSEDILQDFEYLDLKDLTDKFVDLEAMSHYLYDQLSFHEPNKAGTVSDYFGQLLAFIDSHYTQPLFLQELCDQFFINISYCCELFRKVTGMTFSQYVTSLRIKKARELLQNPQLSVQDICEHVGYNDYFYFNKVFKRSVGNTPTEYRKTKE